MYTLACSDEDIKGIEFTVTTLNCQQQQQSTNEESNLRMSLKKSGSIRKAMKSKLSKTRYNSMDLIKNKSNPKSVESSSISDTMEDKSPTAQPLKSSEITMTVKESDLESEITAITPNKSVPEKEKSDFSNCAHQESLPPTVSSKVTKKRSKLYALL